MVANFFESIEVVLLKDVQVGETFNPLTPALFARTGAFVDGYEVCVLKAGSKAWASMKPNGSVCLFDSQKSKKAQAVVAVGDVSPVSDAFPTPMKPVAGKSGLFS